MTPRLKLFLVLIVILLTITLGTFGYVLLEGVTFFDALYMTVITVTSVGFNEVFELSRAGRYLTMALSLGGLIVVIGSITVMTTVLMESQLPELFGRRRMERKIEKLNDHVVICGAGDMAGVVIDELERNSEKIVVVEHDQAALDQLLERRPEMLALHGDATQEHILEQAGVKRAKGLISTLPSDAENLFVCLAAREMNKELKIVTRVEQLENRERIERAGADGVISPEVTGGLQMASLVLHPDIVSFLEVISEDQTGMYRLEKVPIENGCEFVGKTLEEARIPQKTGLIVISRESAESPGSPEFNPTSSTRLQANDQLVVLGKSDQIDQLRELACSQSP